MTQKKTKIYRFYIILNDTEPRIWRRFEILSGSTFRKLHQTIQKVMGWTNSHLYKFEIEGVWIEEPDPEAESIYPSRRKIMKAGETKLHSFLNNEENLILKYTYDFGDSWEHTLKLEKVLDQEEDKDYPRCIEGQMNCPPEDCGGTSGYQAFLEALKDPTHEEHEHLKAWAGGDFDPAQFDLDKINQSLGNRKGASSHPPSHEP
ncbi:MAG: plasmid pRiA4b ORF-3 family protein [Chlamydiae bacterium]|nr:plasmid pRiA4b ORF-3 family protein [Chlamydiota bacterium]